MTNLIFKITFIFSLLFVILLSSCEQSDPPEYELVWSDEFDGEELDLSKWQVQIGDGSDEGLELWGNNEQQYYLEDNVNVKDGSLIITAKADKQIENFNYTSGRIRSMGKADFHYGRIEASIRMSKAAGLWHAFWMLPSSPKNPWPVSGEIDIMELIGNDTNIVFQTIHFADGLSNHQSLGGNFQVAETNIFHQYAIEWNENQITWSIDSVEAYQVNRSLPIIHNTWPFDAEFHILLNTAVGGNLGGTVDAIALQSPKFMDVDYVRVYQLKE